MPLELEAEERGGRLPESTVEEIKREAIAARLHGGRFAPEYGGQGWTMLEWFIVNEQFGRVTNGLHWHVPNAYNVLLQGTPEQVERYLVPALQGPRRRRVRRDRGRGRLRSERDRDDGARRAGDGGWRINGEKWFVTSGDVARVLIVMANVVDGTDRLPTLFLVEPSAPGVEFVDDPKFTHNYPHGHPTIRFTDVEVGPDAVIGGVGNGEELQRLWFTEERLGIATHGLGAMWRLLEETHGVGALARSGRPADHGLPGDLVPARRLGDRRDARAAAGAPRRADGRRRRRPKLIHAKASMAKLFVSEAAGRCADRAVQAFGGRGYLRTNVAERFQRELRVDRIWEGTSEVQRLIISRALERRGVEATIH